MAMNYASLTVGLWIGAIAVGIVLLLVNQICNRRIGTHLEEKVRVELRCIYTGAIEYRSI